VLAHDFLLGYFFPEDGGDISTRNIGSHADYTAQYIEVKIRTLKIERMKKDAVSLGCSVLRVCD
jgi:hypothetical protein